MGHTRKKVDVKIRRKFLFNIQQFDKKTLMYVSNTKINIVGVLSFSFDFMTL